MHIIALACVVLIAVTTVIHYEALQLLNDRLASLSVPKHSKLLVATFAMFLAHAVEIACYGAALYLLIGNFEVGTLQGAGAHSFESCLYFSAETYTSLGFGDVRPTGPVRLLAGVEALNGLLLIGWSASFLYVAMARFWGPDSGVDKS